MMPDLFTDPTIVPPAPSDLGLTPGQNVPGVGLNANPGVGIAAPAIAPVSAPVSQNPTVDQAIQSKIADMSPVQKGLSALSEFGAGVRGKASPLRQGVEDERKNQLLDLAQQKERLSTFVDATKVLNTLPNGNARTQLAENLSGSLGDLGPALKTMASTPGLSETFLNYYKDSPTFQALASQGTAGVSKALTSPEIMKTVQGEIDTQRTPIVRQKINTLLKAAPLLDPELQKTIATRGYATPADIYSLSEAAKNNPQLQPAAFNTTDTGILDRHGAAIYGTVPNVVTAQGAEEIVKKGQESAQSKANAGTWSDPYELGGATVQKNSVTGEIRTAVSRTPASIINLNDPTALARKNAPQAEALYKDYANHPQVKEATDLEAKLKPLTDYMISFAKTGKSINANDAALSKAYLAATTALGNRAYTVDKKELSALPDLGDRLGNMASSFFAGKDLTDQTRKEMFNVIVGRYKALDSIRQQQKAQTISRANARGISPDLVFGTEQ